MRGLVALGCLLCLTLAQDCYVAVTSADQSKILYNYGTVGVTETALTCQEWASQSPQEHDTTAEDIGLKDLQSNYCRDPDESGYPWCYTTDPETRREKCDIPKCDPTDCFSVVVNADKAKVLYGGTEDTTMSGAPCQKWTVTSPQNHTRTPENFPGKGLGDHNYCRDPDFTGYPWCYVNTTDEDVRWEGCLVPLCRDECIDLTTSRVYKLGDKFNTDPCTECECAEDGLVVCATSTCAVLECSTNITLIGQCCPICWEPCMDVRNGFVYEAGIGWHPDTCTNCTCEADESGVKNDDCVVIDCLPLDERCEPEYLPDQCCPVCSMECIKDDEALEYYDVGDRWSQNRDPCTTCLCLDMGGLKKEMCAMIACAYPTHCFNVTYTEGQCCPSCGDSQYDECYDISSNNTVLYDGTLRTTVTGKTCQSWTSQTPNKHEKTPENYPGTLLGHHNYCRDPDNAGYLWCFVDEEETRWEECEVPVCRVFENLHNWDIGDDASYNAIICEDSVGAIECPADKRIVVTEANFGATAGEQECMAYHEANFCETIEDTTELVKSNCDDMSFCNFNVTVDKYGDGCPGMSKYLNVTFYCRPDVPCYKRNQGYAEYNGMRSETITERKCMRWNQQRPHGHDFSPEKFGEKDIGEHNYCRDPDAEGKPWCYTMDLFKRWEFCGVPECKGYDEIIVVPDPSKAASIIRRMEDTKDINCQYVKEGEKAVTYIGKTNETKSGIACQRWTETTPHFHTKMPDKYSDGSIGDHNFCRDPDGGGKLWCYTMDEAKRFEFCDVPECTEDDREMMSKCDDVDCGKGGNCLIDRQSKTACLCKIGYIGYNTTCHDINECKRASVICPGENMTCTNTDGGYECGCPKGTYKDDRKCKDKSAIPDAPGCFVPEFIKTPYNRYDISLDETVIIDCEADNEDTVYWTKGIDNVEIDGTRAIRTSTLRFEKIKKDDIDIYKCNILNTCSELTRTAEVDIHAKVEPCSEPGLLKYGMVWDAKPWEDAARFCNAAGLKFAVPRSKQETWLLIQDSWRSYHLNPNGKKFRDDYWIWVAVNDRLEENDFTDLDGNKITAPRWWPDNPDNWNAMDPRGQDEVTVHRLGGHWDDSYGFIPRPFACECGSATDSNSVEGA